MPPSLFRLSFALFHLSKVSKSESKMYISHTNSHTLTHTLSRPSPSFANSNLPLSCPSAPLSLLSFFISVPPLLLPPFHKQAVIHVDTVNGIYHLTGLYYYLAHFAKYVRPGYRRVRTITTAATTPTTTTTTATTTATTPAPTMTDMGDDEDVTSTS